MDSSAVKAACDEVDVVVSCVSPASGTSTVDMAKSIVTSAISSGVSKFYLVAGLGVLKLPGTTVLLQDADISVHKEALEKVGLPIPPEEKRVEMQEKIKHMTKGHIESIDFMAGTGLSEYTYLCPGVMTEGGPTKGRQVTLGEVGPNAFKVRLGDVAQAIVDDLNVGKLLGHRVGVTSGEA